MQHRQVSPDSSAQVHVLEMLTLFWLFFMSATFILQLQIPDPISSSSDGQLQLAAEDAFVQEAGLVPLDPTNHKNRLSELLSEGDLNVACDALLDGLPDPVQGNCWVAKNEADLARYGLGSTPTGRTMSVHRLVTDSGNVWTVTLQVWYVGGVE